MDKIVIDREGWKLELLGFVYSPNGVLAVVCGANGKMATYRINDLTVMDKPAKKPGRPKSE